LEGETPAGEIQRRILIGNVGNGDKAGENGHCHGDRRRHDMDDTGGNLGENLPFVVF